VHAGKTCGTARGVRRRWRRCRICVSLCRPAGRSCPLSVAGGAVCRGSVTGDGGGGARAPARPPEGETRTRSEPTGGVLSQPRRLSVATTMVRRGGCRTPHVDDVSRPSAESLKNATSPTTRSRPPTTAGSCKCGFRGTEKTKPLYIYIIYTPFDPPPPTLQVVATDPPLVFPESRQRRHQPRRITLFPQQ